MKRPKRKQTAKSGTAKPKRRILPRRKKKAAGKKGHAPSPHGSKAAKTRKAHHPKPRTVAA